MAYLLSRKNEHELCSFWRFSGIIIRGPNRSEKDRHPQHTMKQAVTLSYPVSTVYARNAWVRLFKTPIKLTSD